LNSGGNTFRRVSGNALTTESGGVSILSISSLSMNSEDAANQNSKSHDTVDDESDASHRSPKKQARINAERNSLQAGDYCKLPQIFHRRDLTHKNKLISPEKKIIYKLKVDWTVAHVLDRDGTYLTLKMLNCSGVWEIHKRIWIMYVTKIDKDRFDKESERLEFTLKKLNSKITALLQKVREWHRECGHDMDSRIERVESHVDVHYRCTVCGKVLAVERKSVAHEHAKNVLDIYDMDWFNRSFPSNLKFSLDCREGDGTLVRKKELIFAEKKGWIRKIDRELAMFNSREHLTDALALLSNISMR